MKNEYPQEIEVIPHTIIPMPDGCKLAARIWRPADAGPVPAIFEYLPYRQGDGTLARDAVFESDGEQGAWLNADGALALQQLCMAERRGLDTEHDVAGHRLSRRGHGWHR